MHGDVEQLKGSLDLAALVNYLVPEHFVCYTLSMSTTQIYPAGISYRQPRPRGENSLAAIVFGALGWWLTQHPVGAIAGGAVGNAQPLPLEAALRAHFTRMGLPVIGFYRLGPRAAKVLFRYRDHYWTITSRVQESPNWTPETLDDWLYGDIISQLTAKLSKINASPNQ